MSQILYVFGGIMLAISMFLALAMLFRKIDTNIRNILIFWVPYGTFLAVRLKNNGYVEHVYYLFAVFFLGLLIYQIAKKIRSKNEKKFEILPERRQSNIIRSIVAGFIGAIKKF